MYRKNILSSIKNHKIFIVFFLILITYYFLGLGSYPLISPDEVRYAGIAKNLYFQHRYITPTLNGFVFFDKPILYYWLSIIAYHFFGVSEFSARFFPCCFALLTILFTYIFTNTIMQRRTALLASAILATSPLFWGAAHYSNMDMEVAAWITWALFAFYLSFKKKNFLYLYLSYACIAFGILTKGLIGAALPFMIIFLFLAWTGYWRAYMQKRTFIALLIIPVICLPWFLTVQIKNPEFFYFFFIIQQFKRYLSTDFNDQHGVWFYPVVIFLGTLPWSCWLLGSSKYIKKHLRETPYLWFLLFWLFLILLFFSIPASKLIGYILPVLPAFAILLAVFFNAQCQTATTSLHLTKKRFLKKNYTFAWKKKELAFCLQVLGTMLITLTVFIALLRPIAVKNSQKSIALAMQKYLTQHPNTKVVSWGEYCYDLDFYLNNTQPLYVVTDWNRPHLIDNDNWKGRFLFAAKYHKEQRRYLLLPQTYLTLCHNTKKPLLVILKTKNLAFYPCKASKTLISEKGITVLIQGKQLNQARNNGDPQ